MARAALNGDLDKMKQTENLKPDPDLGIYIYQESQKEDSPIEQ